MKIYCKLQKNNKNKTTNLMVDLRTKGKIVDKYDPENTSANVINTY